MASTYTTVQGDTWDIIAKKVYGSEQYADQLMASNFELLDLFLFSSGTVVKVPELKEEIDSNLPKWRR